MTTVVSWRDDLVEVADRAVPRRDRERPVLPARAAGFEQEAAHQVGRGHVFVTGHRDQRTAELPRHVFDKARLAAAGGALDHHRQARAVGGLEQRHLVALWRVVRLGGDAPIV
jgi:hypothetical protein